MRIRVPRVSLLQHLWYSLYSTAKGTCCFPLSSTSLGLIMFWGGFFGQCISVFTHCLCRLHLQSCSSSSALLHLRPLSRPEPPSVLCLPWFCFTLWVCVCESWRRIELVMEKSRKMQFDMWVPKVTKTSVRWQEFTLQGFQFSHFYLWTEMKTKVLSLLRDSNWSLSRSLLIRQCLKIPNWTEIKSSTLPHTQPAFHVFPFICWALRIFAAVDIR